jgi:hypothetical protein
VAQALAQRQRGIKDRILKRAEMAHNSSKHKMAAFGTQMSKLMMMGKGYSPAEYEADAILDHAARLMADEDALEAAKAEASKTFLYEAITADLRRELEETKSKLLHHTSAREHALEKEVEILKAEKRALEARAHWESQYGIFLPGAFLLANDGECECSQERRLYGGSAAAGGSGGAVSGPSGDCHCGGSPCTLKRAGRKSRTSRRDASGRFVRTCSCGRDY